MSNLLAGRFNYIATLQSSRHLNELPKVALALDSTWRCSTPLMFCALCYFQKINYPPSELHPTDLLDPARKSHVRRFCSQRPLDGPYFTAQSARRATMVSIETIGAFRDSNQSLGETQGKSSALWAGETIMAESIFASSIVNQTTTGAHRLDQTQTQTEIETETETFLAHFSLVRSKWHF